MTIVVGEEEGTASKCWNCGRGDHDGFECDKSAEEGMVARYSRSNMRSRECWGTNLLRVGRGGASTVPLCNFCMFLLCFFMGKQLKISSPCFPNLVTRFT